MKRLPVPPAQDVARIVRQSFDETLTALMDYYNNGGQFNYRPVQSVLPIILGHKVRLDQILHYCLSSGNPAGRNQNAQVAEFIWSHGEGRNLDPTPLTSRKINLRRDLTVRVSADCFFIQDGKPVVFVLQPRKGHALSVAQMGIYGGLVLFKYGVDDFENAGLEILDLSALEGTKTRIIRCYDSRNLPIPELDSLNQSLQVFADAYDYLKKTGFTKPERRRPAKKDDGGFL